MASAPQDSFDVVPAHQSRRSTSRENDPKDEWTPTFQGTPDTKLWLSNIIVDLMVLPKCVIT